MIGTARTGRSPTRPTSGYCLSEYVGAGTAADPYRPAGVDGQTGWSAIDLRASGLNACLLYLPGGVTDRRLMRVGLDPQDSLGSATLTAINSRLGASCVPGRLADVVSQLLMVPPVNGWQAIRPSRLRQRYEIWLGGGLLWSQPVIAGGASISENWNCADSASLTCQLTWTEFVGTAWQLLSNTAQFSDSSGNPFGARADSDLASDDHYCQATLSTYTPATGLSVGMVICRKDSTTTQTFYAFGIRAVGGTIFQLVKDVGGSFTQLGSNGASTPAAGQVLKVESDGSNIRGFVNGVSEVGPIVDSEISGNLRCGLFGLGSDLNMDYRFDDWSAADLAAGGEGGIARGPNQGINVFYGGGFGG